MDKKLFLLDAYALIFRGFYAFVNNPRRTSAGFNTSASYGFMLALLEVIEKEKPSHIAVVFDPPGGSFRHHQFPEYKAHRPPTPEDLISNVPHIKQLIEAMNIKLVEIENYEADDSIGTLAKLAEQDGFDVFIMSPDKDFCQLLTEKVYLYKPKKFGNDIEVFNITQLEDKFGVSKAEQVIDVLALWGDAADNVPGANGIGDKTSKKLINEYGSIEGIYENINKFKGKQLENLQAFKEQSVVSKFLVTIKTDIPFDFKAEEFERREADKEKIAKIFEELEFKTLIRRIAPELAPAPQATPAAAKKKAEDAQQGSLFDFGEPDVPVAPPAPSLHTINDTEHEYFLCQTDEELNQLVELLSQQSEFCFDSETTGLELHTTEIIGLSFSFQLHKAYYVPVPLQREAASELIHRFKAVLENEQILKIAHNIKFDMQMLSSYGVAVKGKLFDTMLAHYLLDPEQRHGMDDLSAKYLGYEPIHIESLFSPKDKNRIDMRKVELEKIKDYAAEDADVTFQLKQLFAPMLEAEKLMALFEEVEMPLVPVLADMELCGVKLEPQMLKTFGAELLEKIIEIERSIIEMAGVQFNVASPKQLGEVLFDKMKIVDKAAKTKTKQYSTSEQDLEKIADKHPIINLILDYRGLKKLLNTYIDSLPDLVNAKTGKIHTSYNQAVASTGRLSSNNPNLQNIPVRTEEGRRIRQAFVASDSEHILLSADYSQIELRLIAHLAQDENMIDAFLHHADIHAATAAKINNISQEEVTRDMRSQAKSANFGIVYGISAFGLSQNLAISRTEAAQLIENYFKTYPKIKAYMDNNIAFARNHHYVETLKGRKRPLKEINSPNQTLRGIAERNAINAPVQGSAADVIKLAMIRIFDRFKAEKLVSKMILQVHDELVFDVLAQELDQVKQIVKEEMENVLHLSVPLTVEMGTGTDWLAAH